MADQYYNDFGKLIYQEITKINEEQHLQKRNTSKITISDIAIMAMIDKTTFCKYLHFKRPKLITVMRIIAALSPTEEAATEIIHAAGYHIGYDSRPENSDYRRIVSNPNMSSDEVNEIFFKYNTAIFQKVKRY